MFRSTVYITILTVVVLFMGCTSTNQQLNPTKVVDVPTTNVDIINTTSKAAIFKFTGPIAVPCYTFKKAIVKHISDTVTVKVRARRTSEMCIQVIDTLVVSPLKIKIQQKGDYIFKFWRGNETPPLKIPVKIP